MKEEMAGEPMNKYESKHFVKHFYDNVELPYRWHEGMFPQEREEWKKALKEKVRELMAFPETMYEKPIVNLLDRKERDTYWIERYEISPEPELWMVFLLLTPKAASEENKTPAVLCAPGTFWTKEALAGEDFWDLTYEPAQIQDMIRYPYSNAMAQHYVRRGITALACEDLMVGEHSGRVMIKQEEYKEAEALEKLLVAQGRSMMGVTVELRMAMMQWLKERPFVDREKLAVSGHSLGCDSLTLLVTLDEDIKAFVHNNYIFDSKERVSANCPPELLPKGYFGCWHMYPGMCQWFTYPDLLAAYAPRKLYITEGGRPYHLERLKQAYAELGAEENYRYDHYREYEDPANRLYDDVQLRPGMPDAETVDYHYVVRPKHYFKNETAVPWLVDVFK